MDLFAFTEFSALFIVSIVFLLSLLGCFVPVIPASPLAFLAILLYKVCIPASSETWTFVIVCAVLTVFAQLLDLLLTYWGAKKFGATWKGTLGAVLGVFVGFFIPPQILWIFLAPVIFAFLFELLGGRNIKESSKAGLGALVGSVIATALKLGIVIAMIVGFFASLNIISISTSA